MRTLIAMTLAFASLPALAINSNLDAPRRGDLVATRLVALPAPAGVVEKQPLSFSWALDPGQDVTRQATHAAESREYWAQVDGATLAKGYAIDTTAPGAVIRISPATDARAVPVGQLKLLRHGQPVSDAQAFSKRSSDLELQQAGMDVNAGSAVVQVAPALGKGRFDLQMAQAQGRYLVHVFEPDSPYVLRASADRASVLAGGQVEVTAVLGNGGKALGTSQMAGLLVSPSGRSYDIAFDAKGRAIARIPVDAPSEPGLWDVQVFAGSSEAGIAINRDARTAIAVAPPTGKLGPRHDPDPVSPGSRVPVQVGSPGRYELRGTLFATGPDRLLHAVSEAHSAAWFTPGARMLTLGFERGHLPTGYGAPFEVRQVQLNDQSRLGQLEQREVAARFAGPVAVAAMPVTETAQEGSPRGKPRLAREP